MSIYKSNKQIISWIKGDGMWNNNKIKNLKYLEKKWGCELIGKDTKMWSSVLGEQIVRIFLEEKGLKVWRPKIKNGLHPDWETEKYIYEVKTRNWNTPGTAGEKILGVPFKYSKVPILYKKPLRIILVAFQEKEGEKFELFEPKCINKIKMLRMWSKMNITFKKCSDLI